MLRLELSTALTGAPDPICNLKYTVAMDAYLEPLATALHALESMPSFLRLAAARLGDSLATRPRGGAFSFLEHVAHLHAAELTFVALSVQNGGSHASPLLEDEEPASRTHDSSPIELFSAARHRTCRTLRRASTAPPIRRQDRHSRRGLTARELTALIRQHDQAHCFAIEMIR
jgi:hypothetical protein